MTEFCRHNKISLRPVPLLLMLIVGEACGFKLWRFASAWPWIATGGTFALLVAFGLGLSMRSVLIIAVPLLGIAVAMRSADAWSSIVDSVPPGAARPKEFVLNVDGAAAVRTNRTTHTVIADFTAHSGPVRARVLAPLKDIGSGRLPMVGETWTCRGWISRTARRHEDGARPFARQTLWVTQAVRTAPASRLAPVMETARAEFARRLGMGMENYEETADMHRALLLGRRGGMPQSRRRTFVAAGTVHVFAISGLHVGLVMCVIELILKWLTLPLRMRRALEIPCVIAYTLLAGAPPSAVRAAAMTVLWCAATVLGRRPDTILALVQTAVAVYFLRPERLFDAGCTLSFAVMAGLAVFFRWTSQFRPLLVPPRSWNQWIRSTLLYVKGVLTITVVAWVAGVPMVAHLFGSFTPGGLLANLAVLPLAYLCVNTLAVGLVLGCASESVAALANRLAGACTQAMLDISERVAGLPWSTFQVHQWTMLECLAWYGACTLVLMAAGSVRRRREDDFSDMV